MPEALGNRLNPSQPNFEIKQRDSREEAAKASRKNSDTKRNDESTRQEVSDAARRDKTEAAALEARKSAIQEETRQKGSENIDKRQVQDKNNPNAGNIINFVA